MAGKTKKTQLGSYICKIGKYDIRHLITPPRKQKNHQGQVSLIAGSVVAKVCKGKKVIINNLKSGQDAIKEAFTLVCKEGGQQHVSKKLISKYKLSCE
tara:strand:+ start:732 stop:1025 length:294 start_codon:yes stop_codon:yes gene_type:complete